jgi:hypothetical protein
MDAEYAKILETEFSPDFVEKMQNRMVASFYKYGPLTEGFPDRVDAIGSLMQRLQKYADGGNTEFLVDVANFAMIEFMRPRHPSAHFRATDSDESPGRRAANTGRVDHRDNSKIGTKGGKFGEFL